MGQSDPFHNRTTLVLGHDEVRSVLDVETGIELQRQAFAELAEGKVDTSPNLWLRPPLQSRGWLKALAGYAQETRALGMKMIARFPENPSGSNMGALIVLFDDTSGFPEAILDGIHITALRTGAGGALATSALARDGAHAVGVVGSGTVAWWTLACLRVECPQLRVVRCYSRSPGRAEAFARRAREELGLDAEPVASVAEATAEADVVITGTNSPEPVVMRAHLRPGQHVNAMGIRTEIAPDAVALARVVPDGHEEALSDGKFSVALAAGAVSAEDLGPTLGEVLLGRSQGRTAPSDITLFDSSGVAAQDLVCARAAVQRAREAGVGTECRLTPG